MATGYRPVVYRGERCISSIDSKLTQLCLPFLIEIDRVDPRIRSAQNCVRDVYLVIHTGKKAYEKQEKKLSKVMGRMD